MGTCLVGQMHNKGYAVRLALKSDGLLVCTYTPAMFDDIMTLRVTSLHLLLRTLDPNQSF